MIALNCWSSKYGLQLDYNSFPISIFFFVLLKKKHSNLCLSLINLLFWKKMWNLKYARHIHFSYNELKFKAFFKRHIGKSILDRIYICVHLFLVWFDLVNEFETMIIKKRPRKISSKANNFQKASDILSDRTEWKRILLFVVVFSCYCCMFSVHMKIQSIQHLWKFQ